LVAFALYTAMIGAIYVALLVFAVRHHHTSVWPKTSRIFLSAWQRLQMVPMLSFGEVHETTEIIDDTDISAHLRHMDTVYTVVLERRRCFCLLRDRLASISMLSALISIATSVFVIAQT